jgi:hypothetical protein
MPEVSDWQQIGQVLIDTGRLALVDPMNSDDVSSSSRGLCGSPRSESGSFRTQ